MLPAALPAMSAASASTIGALLGPIGALALVAMAVTFVVLIAGLVMEGRDLAYLDTSGAGTYPFGDAVEPRVERASRAA